MNQICFNLPGNRTAEDIYKDTAIVNGYEALIPREVETDQLTEAEKDGYSYPDGTDESSIVVEKYTQPDNKTILYKIRYTVYEDNPETDVEFGQKIVYQTFAAQDAELAGKAATERAKRAYNTK